MISTRRKVQQDVHVFLLCACIVALTMVVGRGAATTSFPLYYEYQHEIQIKSNSITDFGSRVVLDSSGTKLAVGGATSVTIFSNNSNWIQTNLLVPKNLAKYPFIGPLRMTTNAT